MIYGQKIVTLSSTSFRFVLQMGKYQIKIQKQVKKYSVGLLALGLVLLNKITIDSSQHTFCMREEVNLKMVHCEVKINTPSSFDVSYVTRPNYAATSAVQMSPLNSGFLGNYE